MVKPKKINKQQLKPKPKKVTNGNAFVNTCPSCLSTLELNPSGAWQCTGDKLEYWRKEIEIFETLNSKDKQSYMSTVNNVSKFNELRSKYKAESVIECEFANSIFNAVPSTSQIVPDPIVIKRLERALKRPLTEEERLGEKSIWVKAGNYFSNFTDGATKVKIPFINFPEEI